MKTHLLTILFFQCALTVHGHGRLTKPLSRKGTGYENDPVRGHTSDDFVCRHTKTGAPNQETVAITAGTDLTMQWDFSAAHVGDCAVFLSYDVNPTSRKEQKYFKIANLFKCREQNRQDITIAIPTFVPDGPAVLRWDWYALHQHPGVEFYSQCVDVVITNNSPDKQPITAFTTYSIVDPPIYPANGRMGVGYRNPFNRQSPQFMTGPACAGPPTAPSFATNNCDLSAKGTTGYTGGGGENFESGGGGDAIGGEPMIGTTLAPGGTPAELEPMCEIYTVKSGDTMFKIAANYTARGMEVTHEEICHANGPMDCDFIVAPDEYIIPYKGSPCAHMGSNVTTQSNPQDGTIAARSTMASFSQVVLAICTFIFPSM